MKTHRVTLRLTDELNEGLRERIRNGQNEGQTLSVIIRHALELYLNSPRESDRSELKPIKIKRQAPRISERDEKQALRELQQW